MRKESEGKMNGAEKNDEGLFAMAFLLEFYGKGILDRFQHVCREHECDVSYAFVTLKYLLLQHLALEQDCPSFSDLAAMYAERMEIDVDEFTRHFLVPRRES